MSFWDDLAQVGSSALEAGGGLVGLIPGMQGIGASIAGAGAAWKTTDNFFLQQDTQNYQKNLQQQMFAREDNAAQRRAADYAAAGINPQLAAGSVAPAGVPISVGTPQGDTSQNVAANVLDLMRGSLQNDQIRAQTDLARATIPKVEADTAGQEIANAFAAGTNPLKKTGLELQVAFDTAANPVRLKQLSTALQGANIDNINKGLDTKLKDLGISMNQLQLVYQKYANASALEGLNVQQKDAAIKGLTIDAMTLSNQQLSEQTQGGVGLAKTFSEWGNAVGGAAGKVLQSMPK